MRPAMLSGILETLEEGQTELRFKDGSQLQVVDSLDSMVSGNIRKFQYACLIRHEKVIFIWHDDFQHIIPTAEKLEKKLLSMVWGDSLPFNVVSNETMGSEALSTRKTIYKSAMAEVTATPVGNVGDLESVEASHIPESLSRPVIWTSAVYMGLAVGVAIFFILKASILELIIECLLDGTYLRLAILATVPLLLCVSLFFFLIVTSNAFQMFGPIGGQKKNSRYYSCIKPSLRQAYMCGFQPPHITIQVPVYKEGLDTVIVPTVRSLQAAISYYESHGGTASIFINDDGMRVISDEAAVERDNFYHDNNIAWVARPKHGEDGFQRKGKFKKASNMNYAMNLSQKIEAYMYATIEAAGSDMMNQSEEDEMYEQALRSVLEENPKARAKGNIRVGEFILIVDSDTRVVSIEQMLLCQLFCGA